MADAVPSREFIGDFDRFRARARTEVIPVSTDGDIDGYFVGPKTYEALRRAASRVHAFAVEEVSDEMAEAIAETHMDPRHAHLDVLLDHD